jgi:hypothetical protein
MRLLSNGDLRQYDLPNDDQSDRGDAYRHEQPRRCPTPLSGPQLVHKCSVPPARYYMTALGHICCLPSHRSPAIVAENMPPFEDCVSGCNDTLSSGIGVQVLSACAAGKST